MQHALVDQEPQRQILGVVTDRHRRHDLLRIQENRQRAFLDHRDLADLTILVHAFNGAGQAGRTGIWGDDVA